MGPRKKLLPQLTRLELQIMKVLWEKGPATVQEVQKNLKGESLAYTTVQTMLNVLHRKGRVKRKLYGKAYQYAPLMTQDKAMGEALVDIVDRMFGGSAEALVMSLVKTQHLDARKLEKLNELIKRHQSED
jgi:BlaI family transcriptional regulator, penicillinase repressor